MLSALKRGFYIKSAKEKRKKQPCTERHYQSSVVIKEYIDIEKKIELEKQKKLGEKIVEMGKTVADEIQRGNSAVIYTICI